MWQAHHLGKCCVFALLVLGIGCSSPPEQEETEQTKTPEGEDCTSNKDYFAKKVWTPILEQRCFSCHNTSGQAKYTNLVFQPSSQTGHIEANLASLQRTARYEANGKSVLLQKPLGELEHKGGALLTADSEEFKAIEQMLVRLDNPIECEDTLTVDSHFANAAMLDEQETLRKTTLNLGGRLPTDEEIALVNEEGIDGLDKVVDNLAKEEVFYDRLGEMFNDMFLTDRYLGGSNAVGLLDRDIFPEARWYDEDELSGESEAEVEAARQYANNSVAREPLELINYVVRNDKPFTEILTADYMLVNPFSARVYGVTDVTFDDPLDPNEWREGHVPGQPHAGVLSSPMFLNRFPTTATNRNRHRSRMVYSFFLATDVMALAERPLDPTSIEDFNPTLYNPQCTTCHTVIDPVAGAFQNWTGSGMYSPPESGWHEDMLPPGFGDSTIAFEQRNESLAWLANKFATDQRFATATVYNVYEGVTGHSVIVPLGEDQAVYDNLLVAREVQQMFFDQLAQDFIESDYNLKAIIKGLVKSPYFRASNISEETDGEQRHQFAELGTGRLLTPEMLDRKISAVLGSPWVEEFNKGRHYLLRTNQYEILYGGIDSNDVTQRITEPNGIMANVQWRMANEMACRVTARDFVTADPTQRRFFPLVEPSFVPEDENGFVVTQGVDAIKKNIQHLHWHLLGERLPIDDPELERTYNLFYDTWKEGQTLLGAGEIGDRLTSRCRATSDFMTGEEYPEERRISNDPNYTIRAWQAVITYMLADHKFLYE